MIHARRTCWAVLWIPLLTAVTVRAQPASQPSSPEEPDAETRARMIRARTVSELFLDDLYRQQFARAALLMDQNLIGDLPPERLVSVLFQIEEPIGSSARPGFESMIPVRGGAVQVSFQGSGPAGEADVTVAVGPSGEIIGLRIVPHPKPAEVDWPDYVDIKQFKEQKITFGDAPWVMQGSLTVPVGEGPFAGVVLLQGWGPRDRDERTGPNRPFRDLAWGLATRGIAVLRYDKRTLTYGQQMADFGMTLDAEVFDDARAALEALRRQPKVDPDRVFLVGHTFGATLAPAVAQMDGHVDGVVMLAPSAIPVLDLLVKQGELQAKDAPTTQAATDALEQVRAAVEQIQNHAVPPRREVLGVPAEYWYELKKYDGERAIAATRSLGRPVLILCAGRDAALTGDDFAIWKEKLAGVRNITVEDEPDLTQQFMPGEGAFSPSEYTRPNHVAERVVDRIAAWIRTVPPVGD